MKFCINCNQNVEPEKKFNWAAFVVGGIMTGGLLILIYPLYYLTKTSRCPICKSKNWR